MSADPARLGEVVPLVAPRARLSELASNSPPLEEELASSFAELVRKLEIADGGRPLYGRGRAECVAAQRSYPRGFAAAVEEAGDAKVERHCGLLVKLVREGWHISAEAIASGVERGSSDRFTAYDFDDGVCADCEVGGGRHLADCPKAASE